MSWKNIFMAERMQAQMRSHAVVHAPIVTEFGRLDMLREEISAVQTEKARNLIRRRPVSRTTR